MPSRLKRSSAQNSAQSNLRRLASSNKAANCLRSPVPLRPLTRSMYSPTMSWPELVHQVAELVLRVLALVLSRHPRIDRNAHAETPQDLNVPAFDSHRLEGGRYTLHVNGPWCVTFEFERGDAYRVDYEQYH